MPIQRAVLTLGYGLGLRAGEMARLALVDLTTSQVRVRLSKGDRGRLIPLDGWASREVRHYLAHVRPGLVARARARGFDGPDPGAVLVMSKGAALKPYESSSFHSMLSRLGERVGVPTTTHDLRRSFGRRLYEGGATLPVIQKLLGHRDVATTIEYLGLDLDDMASALREMYDPFTCTETDLASSR
jgi:site-specific recombinase XerD